MSNVDTVKQIYAAFGRGDIRWFFDAAGKVVKYQHITDTALHQRVAKGQ